MNEKVSKPKDVDAYIANAAEEAQPTLKEIRELIKSTIPEAEEAIKWGVPWYTYQGMLSGFRAYKNHVSIEIWADELQSEHREMLEDKGYKTGKRTFQIKYDQEVPTTAIKKILKAQAAMNEEKSA